MPVQITFVRHAETTYNAEHRWQGSSNVPLSEQGLAQAEALRRRLAGQHFDAFVSSDLERAAATARAIASDVSTDARWREPNVGLWEGLTHTEIQARYPGDLRRMLDGEDVALGGGERMSEVGARLDEALRDLVASLGDDGSALVVSHGLALLTLFAGQLGARRPTPIRLMENASMSELSVGERGSQLTVYNDIDHLGGAVHRRPASTHVVLVRHGQTKANVERRWQGHTDWPLDEVGTTQAKELAQRLPAVDALYASPLRRALATARALADQQAHDVILDNRLKEIGFGAWENRTREEIERDDPDGLAALLRGDDDVRRGGNGETFAEVQQRMTEAVTEIAMRHDGGSVAVVSHGGATRAFVTRLLGIDFRGRYRLGTLRNAGVGRIEFSQRGPALAQWNALA